jgi:hypothetical protein
MLETIGWIYLGAVIGFISAVVLIGMLRAGKDQDQESEIQDLRVQRSLLKEEIFRLTEKSPKPRPRSKRRPYKRKKSPAKNHK